MERDTNTCHETGYYETRSRAMGKFATRLMEKLHRKPSSERRRSEGAVVYRGSGAPLLGENPGIGSKEDADAFIDALLGRNQDR